MRIEQQNNLRLTDYIEAGEQFLVVPDAGASVQVRKWDGDVVILAEVITAQTIYGPYQRDVHFTFDCLVGTAIVTKSPDALRELMQIGAMRWDDLRFPAQGINPAGSTSAPDVITTETGLPGCFSFPGNANAMIAGVAQMPHSWRPGTAIRPHIHWSKDTGSADAVSWQLYIRHFGSPGDAQGAWSSAIDGTIAAGSQLVTGQHLVTTFGEVDMTGRGESAMMAWRLYRRGGTDADAADATFYEFDIHFRVEKGGTRQEFGDF
jgi:hypothetical protein